MKHLKCGSKFRIFEPLEEWRIKCPYILVTISGDHLHPIPLPLKTPPLIHKEILHLLGSVGEDLPDLTPRRFLRHPILKDYLQQHFPNAHPPPTLSNLHVSLANREHLNVYIETAKKHHFPAGTGWEGLSLLKKIQDETLPPKEHYIRRMIYLTNIPLHEEDDPVTDGDGKDVRIVICMTRQGSRRLWATSYTQSDMAFARILGYHEFEIASVDRINNPGMFSNFQTYIIFIQWLYHLQLEAVTFCRVYVTRQTAAVHQQNFQEIEDIVEFDTGECLRWCHLHARHIEETAGMILLWTMDQHGGQAKGLWSFIQLSFITE